MIRRSLITLTTSMLLLIALMGVAGAHSTVFPKTVNADSYEKFTVRVPVEKESATVKVRVDMPEGFVISRVKPLAGWTYELAKGADGKAVKAITWSGGKIEPGEFQEFEFQGKSAKDPGKYAFPSYQTYADGETVAWTGPSDAKTPAPVVEVKATGAAVDAPKGANPLTTAAAYGGLLLGGAALLIALRRK